MQENNYKEPNEENEIDLIQLIKILWEGRRIIVKTTIIFMLVGIFVAIFSQKEYTASTTIVPQSAEGGSHMGGSLGGLAAMAGINLGNLGGGSDIPPTLYPKILNSIAFQKELMKTPLTIEGQLEPITFAHYYEVIYKPGLFGYIKKYSFGLPHLIVKALRGNGKEELVKSKSDKLISISPEENELIERIHAQLSIAYNEKDGYVSLYARMPEPKAAAQMAQKAQVLLQEAITAFKIQKAKDQLDFVTERYIEKKKESQVAQKKLAEFRDRNKNVSTATAQTELERLTAEYNLVYGVYSELAKQMETQKIKVKEDTPVFTVIEPVTIPLYRSQPQRAKLLILYTMIGIIISMAFILGKCYWNLLKKRF